METWYCRDCGDDFELGECPRAPREGSSFLGWRRCPACGGRVAVSGAALIVIGMLVAVFMGLLSMDTLGLVLGGGIVALGVWRLYKQLRLRGRRRSE